MFEFIDVEQNTDEWYQLRAGRITSSNLGKMMANFGKSFGEPAKKYAVQIAVEQITGTPASNSYSNAHMERGHEQEPIARQLYENEMFCDVLNGGFFKSQSIGCSPDGLVGNDGVIEIKSVIDSVHFANVKRGGIDPAYKWQCIGNLKFTGLEWLDFISYCSTYPDDKQLYVSRITPDELTKEFDMIDLRVDEFLNLIYETKTKILDGNYRT